MADAAEEEKRVSVALAASLFGSSDSAGADFFGENLDEGPAQPSVTGDIHPQVEAASLFGQDTAAFDDQFDFASQVDLGTTPDAVVGEFNDNAQANYDTTHDSQDYFDNPAYSQPETYSANGSYVNQDAYNTEQSYPAPGWYDEQGQWQSHPQYDESGYQQEAYTDPTAYSQDPYATQSYAQDGQDPYYQDPASYASDTYQRTTSITTSAYDPYTPQPNSGSYLDAQPSIQPRQVYSAPQATPEPPRSTSISSPAISSAYDPYRPTSSTPVYQTSSYSTPSTSTVNTTHQYLPPTTTASSYSPSNYAVPRSVPAPLTRAPVVADPAPAAPSADVSKWRTTTYNAYDPPAIPIRQKSFKPSHTPNTFAPPPTHPSLPSPFTSYDEAAADTFSSHPPPPPRAPAANTYARPAPQANPSSYAQYDQGSADSFSHQPPPPPSQNVYYNNESHHSAPFPPSTTPDYPQGVVDEFVDDPPYLADNHDHSYTSNLDDELNWDANENANHVEFLDEVQTLDAAEVPTPESHTVHIQEEVSWTSPPSGDSVVSYVQPYPPITQKSESPRYERQEDHHPSPPTSIHAPLLDVADVPYVNSSHSWDDQHASVDEVASHRTPSPSELGLHRGSANGVSSPPPSVPQPIDNGHLDEDDRPLGSAPVSHNRHISASSVKSESSPPYDPYAPANHTKPPPPLTRVISPSFVPPPPPPAVQTPPPPAPYSIPIPSSSSPYHPTKSVYTSGADSVYGYPSSSMSPPKPNSLHAPLVPISPYAPASTIGSFDAPAAGAYVPSNSHNGRDDPRLSARIPIFRFGFGGRVASCFHAQLDVATGFDVSLAARKSSPILVRKLCDLIPIGALETSTVEFPGPLYSTASGPAMAIIKTTTSVAASSKSKKASVLKFLTERAEEQGQGLGYLSSEKDSQSERNKAEGKLALLKLLAVMIENDGKLYGSSTIEAQVRAALLPTPTVTLSNGDSSPNTPFGFATPATSHLVANEALNGLDGEIPLATYHLRGSFLDKLQSFLLKGERRQAYHYALDQKMWAHAMVIAGSVDKDAWMEAANEFIQSELGVHTLNPLFSGGKGAADGPRSVSNGRETLRVAYSLFSGQGANAVQQLLPPKVLARTGADSLTAHLLPMPQATPVSPNFPKPTLTGNIPFEVLAKWSEAAAVIVSNSSAGENPAALTALGDYLISNKWIEAAHVCYLLSPQTSTVNGVGSPSVRVVLLSSESPHTRRNFHTDVEAIQLTEILEYALSLPTTPKGQEGFTGLAHLQAYKLLRALRLAELGHVKAAAQYCEAITAVLKLHTRGSPFFTSTFLELHKELTDRLVGRPDRNASWLTRKMSKPNMDSIGGWYSRFVAGESDEPSPVQEETQTSEAPGLSVGPFSHYSEISSATTSQAPSPNGSVTSFSMPSSHSFQDMPRRSDSAMASRPVPNVQIDRSASVMGYLRPVRSSPVGGRAYSAHPSTTTFQSSSSGFTSAPTVFTPLKPEGNSGDPVQEASWWGSQSYGDESAGDTPKAASFQPADESDSSNFVSLMDAYSPAPTPGPSTFAASQRRAPEPVDEEEEDLGFGNSSFKAKKENVENESSATDQNGKPPPNGTPPAAAAVSQPKPPDLKPKSSWLGGWFSKKEAEPKSPGPVRANLGESKNSFYYDKELKKWVNGKEGASQSEVPPSPPPPPSRAQTASPGTAMGHGRPPPSSGTPPPPRPQSTINAPPPSSLRIRSGLSESFVPEIGGAASGPGVGPPPPRGKSAQGRKGARAKYVDIFANPPPT